MNIMLSHTTPNILCPLISGKDFPVDDEPTSVNNGSLFSPNL